MELNHRLILIVGLVKICVPPELSHIGRILDIGVVHVQHDLFLAQPIQIVKQLFLLKRELLVDLFVDGISGRLSFCVKCKVDKHFLCGVRASRSVNIGVGGTVWDRGLRERLHKS